MPHFCVFRNRTETPLSGLPRPMAQPRTRAVAGTTFVRYRWMRECQLSGEERLGIRLQK